MNTESATRLSAKTQAVITPSAGDGSGWLSYIILSDSCIPMDYIAHQAPLSERFSRQEYWSGLPFPPPGDLPDPGMELMSPALAGTVFTIEPPGVPLIFFFRVKQNNSPWKFFFFFLKNINNLTMYITKYLLHRKR